MSTVEETPVKAYKMPSVKLGQIVNFFVLNRGSGARPIACVVHEVSAETVWLKSLGDKANYDSVRHLSDPKLENVNQRDNGGWDYTDDHKELIIDRKILSEKLRGLETRLSRLESNRK